MNNFIVKIDQEKCVGSGQCVANAPLIFMQSDEDGLVQLIQKKVDSDYLNEVKTAMIYQNTIYNYMAEEFEAENKMFGDKTNILTKLKAFEKIIPDNE